MAQCGLIALDLDGTALDGRHELAPETCQAIARARGQGVRVVIATGRSSQEAAWYARKGRFDSLAIALGGAAITDCASGRQLQRWDLPLEAGQRVLGLCLERRLHPMIFAGERILMPTWSREALGHYFPQNVLERDVEWADDPLARIQAEGLPLTKLHVEGDAALFPLEEAAALPGVEITSSSSADFELLPQGVDKGRALALLAGMYGIPLERCAAVGDSGNDVEMLRAAGLSFAMGNACQAAAQAAGHRVADNLHHGAAQAIGLVL